MTEEIRIDLADDDLEPAELEQVTLALRQELLQLDDVDAVSAASSGPAPDGSRAVGLAEVGSLIVAARPVVEVAAKVIGVVRSWLSRRSQGNTATLKITVGEHTMELTPTDEQQAALVEQFLRSVGSEAPGAS